jgi:hypothetical protein
VAFDYEPKEPWLTPPGKRGDFNNWLVSVRISPKSPAKLISATAYLMLVRRKTSDGWSVPLNETIRATLAWPEYEQSFEARDVVGNDFLALFNVTSDGKTLSLLNDKSQRHEFAALNDLSRGEYKLTILLTAQNLERPVLMAVDVQWYGDVSTLKIDPNFSGG